jgi:DNA-binding MltR family transcriptional regulator
MENEPEFNPAEDYEGFLEEFQNESPRAAAIIGAAFLDEQLRKLLVSFLVDRKRAVDELIGNENRSNRPLSAFSARIRAAYCLGLISKDERDDLHMIRRIRNRFAHRLHDLSFDDKEIVDRCNSLEIPRSLPLDFDSHRDKFVIAVHLLSNRLALRVPQAAKERRVVPRGFRLGQVVRVTREK